MRRKRVIRLGIEVVLLAVLLSTAGCATTRYEQDKREYRRQEAAERFCEALVDFIIESI